MGRPGAEGGQQEVRQAVKEQQEEEKDTPKEQKEVDKDTPKEQKEARNRPKEQQDEAMDIPKEKKEEGKDFKKESRRKQSIPLLEQEGSSKLKEVAKEMAKAKEVAKEVVEEVKEVSEDGFVTVKMEVGEEDSRKISSSSQVRQLQKKSCIRETSNLSTDADSSTDARLKARPGPVHCVST